MVRDKKSKRGGGERAKVRDRWLCLRKNNHEIHILENYLDKDFSIYIESS